MIRRCLAGAVPLLSLLTVAMAQPAGQGPVRGGPPPVRVIFGAGVPFEKAWVAYGVFGPSGGHRSIDVPKPSGPLYEIGAVLGDRVRVLVWSPGCKIKEFDLQFEGSNGELQFVCEGLKSVTLAGRVREVDLAGRSGIISVAYDAAWPCTFLTYCKERFCQVSCAWQGIPLGDADVEADGTFKIDLPDFSSDPIASDGGFSFVLRTGKREVIMEGVGIAASYPADLTLVPHNWQAPMRIRVSEGVSQSLLVKKVEPQYPEDARHAHIQGPVVLKGVIDTHGEVENLTLVSGHPALAPAAIDAVKKWKYKPYVLNGQPVKVETQITVSFQLQR